jgi:fructose-bisphosphate aldolase class 1
MNSIEKLVGKKMPLVPMVEPEEVQVTANEHSIGACRDFFGL